MARILWLDNEPGYISPYETVLREHGHEVTVVSRPKSATELIDRSMLDGSPFDLLILDAMLSRRDLGGIEGIDLSDGGLEGGALFLAAIQAKLLAAGTRVLVITLRLDEEIRQRFGQLGIAGHRFATKLELRRDIDFMARVSEVLK